MLNVKGGLAVFLALLPLYCLVLGSSQPQQNKQLLSQYVSKELSKDTLTSVLTLWDNQEYQAANLVLATIDPADQPLVNLYQPYMDDYLLGQQSYKWSKNSGFPSGCTQKIVFVTGELQSLSQAKTFKHKFSKDKRLNTLPICVHVTTFFDPDTVLCQANWLNRGRLGCDLLPLAEHLKDIDFTHIVIFADKGKANVHNGIMFLDKKDTYDVFVHELAHFSGFIDEYPLSTALAKRVCAGVDAPNLEFKQAGEQAELSSKALARTCDNHTAQAFKVSSKLTFMEYHDIGHIPSHYLSAWHSLLIAAPKHPSAHLNFAQLYEEAGNHIDSQYWRQQYQGYLRGI